MVAFAAGRDRAAARSGASSPPLAAGLSLGEYSALHAAGVFDADTAVELVAFRGKAMEEAARGRPCGHGRGAGAGPGAAAGVPAARPPRWACVEIANYNCPGQLVIGGETPPPWRRRAALAKEAGARRCVPLKVSGPFHTSLMAPAGDGAGGAVPHRGLPGAADPRGLQLPGRGAWPEGDDHPGAAGAAGAEQRLHGGYHPRAWPTMGWTRVVEIGPGKALQRLCEKDRPRSMPVPTPVETAAELDS